MDILVTLCSHAEEYCPKLPSDIKRFHWPIKDPVGTAGTDEEVMKDFRRAREEIKEKVQGLIKYISDSKI
jgi:arsenate reductase